MRIKSLQITGFKSFVDKTLFRFEPGITGRLHAGERAPRTDAVTAS